MLQRRMPGIGLFVVVVLLAIVSPAAQTALTPDQYTQLKFRYIGPVGNRIVAVAGVPGNPNVYYAGAASGGIFKTTDNGAHWEADLRRSARVIDRVARGRASDPNVVWAGTGEAFIRSNISIGNGI